MENNTTIVQTYLEFCKKQKRLDSKTIRAYRIDLDQFLAYIGSMRLEKIMPTDLEKYIQKLLSSIIHC